MASAEEGFDDQRFPSPVPQNLHCAICLNVLRNPMQCVKNEHSFCHPCITRYLQESPKCPTCLEPLTLQTLRPSRVVTNLLSEIMIKCDNVADGCPAVVKLESLDAHVARCGFSFVQCSNSDCHEIIKRRDQQHHQENACKYRRDKCQDCGKEVPYGKRTVHCYVTKTEMDKMKGSLKDEMASMKEIVMTLSQDLTRHMSDMTSQMNEIKSEIAVMQKQLPGMKQATANPNTNSGPCIVETRVPQHFPVPSMSHQEAITRIKRDILVAGGYGLNSVEQFSWTTRQWSHLPPMTSKRWHSSSFVHQGKMFVCGGRDCETSMEVLPLENCNASWKTFPVKLPDKTCGHASIIYGDKLLIFGGCKGWRPVSDIYEVSLVPPYSCQQVGYLPEPRMWHGAQRFGEMVVVLGFGTRTDVPRNSLESVVMYNIDNNHCYTLAPLPFSVHGMATVALEDNIIIFGGQDKSYNALNTVVSYNVKEQKSKMLPPMKHKRRDCTAVITEDVAVVMGGFNEKEGQLNSVECFHFNSSTWEELPPMKEKRQAPTAVIK